VQNTSPCMRRLLPCALCTSCFFAVAISPGGAPWCAQELQHRGGAQSRRLCCATLPHFPSSLYLVSHHCSFPWGCGPGTHRELQHGVGPRAGTRAPPLGAPGAVQAPRGPGALGPSGPALSPEQAPFPSPGRPWAAQARGRTRGLGGLSAAAPAAGGGEGDGEGAVGCEASGS